MNRKNNRRTEVIVASHTHWDRAWYQPFQNLRSRLVHVVDELLEIFATRDDFQVFNFDGQVVVLEDYLAIRPEKRKEIERLVKTGRLKVGPWYVLADEFLAGGEALIRNLLIGHKVGNAFGGVSKVGYTPDSFGHVSQMPQILNGFGIDSFMFSRGLSTKAAKMGQVFRWFAPDGKSWGHAGWLPKGDGMPPLTHVVEDGRRKPLPWPEIRDFLEEHLAFLEKHRHPGVLLVFSGNDHAPAELTIGEMVKLANSHLKGYRFVHSSFDRYVELVKRKARRLSSHSGELRDGGPFGLLSGTQSSRMYLKQANEDCKSTLTKLAEPVCCLASLAGFPYPHAELEHAWKKLLKNHPHDDICGCSVDGVHRDMVTRFRNCIELSEQLAYRSLYWLSHVAEKPVTDGPRVIAGHGLPARKRYRFKHTFDIADPKPRTAVVDSTGKPQPAVPGIVRKQIVHDWDIRTGSFRNRTQWQQEMEWLGELPPCGYEQFVAAFGKNPATDISAKGGTIENSLVRVKMRDDGSVTITDKKTRLSVRGNIFEDNEDSGDGYDYSRLAKSPPTIRSTGMKGRVRSRLVGSLAAEVTCELKMKIPVSLTADHKARSGKIVPLRIRTTARLLPGERRVEFHTIVDNNARDHRLRVVFRSGVERAETVEVEGAFDVLKRPIDLPPKEETADWAQKPIPTKHQDGFVSVSDAKRGLTLINRGLPEYEARRDRGGVSLVLTLFRAFSHLAMDDHFERGSAAGPVVPTPDAQCQGTCVADYAVVLHKGNWEEACTWTDAHAFNSPAGTMEAFTDSPSGKLPRIASLLTIDNPAAVASAIKGPESGEGLAIRLWNISSKPISPTLTTMFRISSVSIVDMLEKPLRRLKHGERSVKLPGIRPKEIVTVLIRRRPLAPKVRSTDIMWPTCAGAFRTY